MYKNKILSKIIARSTIIFLLGFEFFVAFSNADCSTALAQEVAALARIPVGIAANKANLNDHKTKAGHAFILLNDVLRLSSSFLAIANKREVNDFHSNEFDFQSYDRFWALYDSASLLAHIRDCFIKKEEKPENDSGNDVEKKLKKSLIICHSIALPIIEGFTALVVAHFDGVKNSWSQGRVLLKWINTATRLVDNIIINDNGSDEQIVYGFLLVASIVECIRQLTSMDKIWAQEREKRHKMLLGERCELLKKQRLILLNLLTDYRRNELERPDDPLIKEHIMLMGQNLEWTNVEISECEKSGLFLSEPK